MNRDFSIIGLSEKYSEKSECGDYECYSVDNEEKLIILVISDGVGSRHHDYVASRTACEEFLTSFEKLRGEEISERIFNSVKNADKAVSEPENIEFKGMMATFLAVIVDLETNIFYHCNIGDSRLYRHTPKGFEKITTDDKKAVIMKDRGGKMLSISGSLVVREGITNALGYNGAEISVRSSVLNSSDCLILCTDGMYEISGFEDKITQELAASDLDFSINKFVSRNKELYTDDATLLVFRSEETTQWDKDYFDNLLSVENPGEELKIARHTLVNLIQRKLQVDVKERNNTSIEKIVTIYNSYGLLFSEDFISFAISLMKEENFMMSSLYRLLISELRKIKS